MTNMHDLTTHVVPIDSVTEHPRNARHGDVDTIEESLSEHAQYAPIVVQRSTRQIIKGNHTYLAAKRLGWETITAVMLDVDDDQAIRIMLMDNRASDLGGYEEQSLTELLSSLTDLSGTGYDPDDLDARLAELAAQGEDLPLRPAEGDESTDWDRKDARTVQLTYTIAEHAKLTAALDTYCGMHDLPSYSAAVAHLVARAAAQIGL